MTKYFQITATSITRYNHFIKVPDSFTINDIWELQEADHSMFDGGMFTEDKYSSDWEFDDIFQHKEDEKGFKLFEKHFKYATEYTTEELNDGN